ncbi:DUF4012 domain-containing protein [Demequina rhizosphaerae]|uniref:DUF4012 domain-containing protein n=1 Tax=Demequina rhizosphaerae TaxID=1638985 RepID=UPI0007825910|nr:DUF4012 domain-containing protein [Demequina rhizosphaerae]
MIRRHRAAARRRLLPWLLGGAVIACFVLAGAFAWDAVRIKGSTDALASHARAAKEAIADADIDALRAEVAVVEAEAQAFAGSTDGPHWWLATHTPWVEAQAVPIVEAAGAVEAMAEDALTPLAGMEDLSALAAPEVVDGRLDPHLFEPYRATLAQASEALDGAATRLDRVDLGATVDAVATAFRDVEGQLGEVRSMVTGAHVAAELFPSMLAADGERHYLVMVQNNAEPRTTGGIPGAVIELVVRDGVLSIGRYAPASSMVDHEGVGGLTADEERLFGDLMEVYPQDVNFTPEYPRSGEMMTRFWTAEYGESVDGVLSIDPVAMGWMLEGSSPVEVGPFAITAENFAQVVLNEAYFTFEDPAEQDAFFAQASSRIFSTVLAGGGSALGAVERAIDAGRLMLWSADAHEQELLAPTSIGGEFLGLDDAIGLFLNDGSESKIGWYIDTETTVTDHLCTDGSLAGQTVELALTHTYDGAVANLPDYISGGNVAVPAGEFHTNVLLYPAEGTGVTKFTQDGRDARLNPETHDGRTLATARVALEPGQSTTLSFEIAANGGEVEAPTLVETPGPKPNVYTRSADALVDGC